MAPIRVRPTRADISIANAISDHTDRSTESVAEFLTWGADEHMFDQERPDRRTFLGHWRGVPFSGERLDAFPSGHAVHVGALASAASRLPAKQRNLAWAVGAGLVLTRVVLLAHWASDVVAGLAVGAVLERMLRLVTGYGRDAATRHPER